MRALLLAVALLALAAPLASAAESAEEGDEGFNSSRYLEGTRDPANRVWWTVALVALVALLVGALWLMGVLPR